jgi:hypothetical protein
MKPRLIITAVLLAFVALSVAFFIVKEVRRGTPTDGGREEVPGRTVPAQAENIDEARSATDVQRGVIVYYFHGTRRCSRCMKFEEYTNEAITTAFPEELKNGDLALRVVNVDEPENGHYVREYGLATKSVVLVDARDGKEGRWRNLPKIWDLVDDKSAFIAYIQNEVTSFREER